VTAPTVNFASLAAHDAVLVEYAAEAEGLFRGHPRLCVANLRTLAEALAKHAAAYAGIYVGEREELGLLLGRLRDRGVTDGQIGAIVPPPDPTGPDGVAEAEAAELTDYFNARLSPNRLRGINPPAAGAPVSTVRPAQVLPDHLPKSRPSSVTTRELERTCSNLLAAYLGGQGKPRNKQDCDTHSGERDSKLNPADPAHHVEQRLRFQRDGGFALGDVDFDGMAERETQG
jgi:hypothetical protein